MSEITERFIRLYEDLVEEVNRRSGSESSHSFEIERAASRDGAVRKHDRLLKYIRDVRHALQHPKHRSPGHAVVISEAFVEEIENLLKHLRNPPVAGNVGIARKLVRAANLADRLGNLADEMTQGGFSHVPILNERDVVIGVFNEAAVFDYLWNENETIIGREMRVSDILQHCRLESSRTEVFRFIGPRTSIDALTEMFLAVESPTTRVGAAFVTASGKSNEPLQRLITPWDILATSAS